MADNHFVRIIKALFDIRDPEPEPKVIVKKEVRAPTPAEIMDVLHQQQVETKKMRQHREVADKKAALIDSVLGNDAALKLGTDTMRKLDILDDFNQRELRRKIQKLTDMCQLDHIKSSERKLRTLVQIQTAMMNSLAAVLFARKHLDQLFQTEKIDNVKYNNSLFNIRYLMTRFIGKNVWDGLDEKLGEEFEEIGKEIFSFVANMENYAIRKAGMNAWEAGQLRTSVAKGIMDSFVGGSTAATDLFVNALDTAAALSYGAGKHY